MFGKACGRIALYIYLGGAAMTTGLRAIVWAGLLSVFFAAISLAQDLQTKVTYVCNGERMVIDSCNIRDLSDTSKCMVGHPDTILSNGLMKYTYETRGDLKKLLPTCKQPSPEEVKRAQAFQKKIDDQQAALQRNSERQMKAPPPGQQVQTFGASQPSSDPETRRMNRCIAAGRPPSTCLGNTMEEHFFGQANSILSSVAPDVVGKETTGPQMAGAFEGKGDWRLEFVEASVLMTCAGMHPEQHTYRIAITNNRAVITIQSTPKPVVLTISTEGLLTAPGPIVVDGSLSAGSRQETNYDGSTTTKYLYRSVTRTCAQPNLTSKGVAPTTVSQAQSMLSGMLSGGEKGPPSPSGLRMNGTYAVSSGFSVEFHPDSAILGCGPDVARAYPYVVQTDGKEAAVKIAAATHPLTLVFKTNNTLDPGSGPYVVEGRRITGKDSKDDFTFAPMNATCNLAVLSPGQVPSVAVATSSSSLPALSGDAVLTIVSGLPAPQGIPNALASHPYVLLREDVATVIRKSGATILPGMSPENALGAACAKGTPDCQTMLKAIREQKAALAFSDGNGKATFPGLPPGSYYLMISTRYNNQGYRWSFKVDLKSGPNSITLDQSNGTVAN
jgi:hypothetical protein